MSKNNSEITDPSKPTKPKKAAVPSSHRFKLDLFLIELMGKFGITGLVSVTVISVFLKDGTKEQHQMFIDKFILFNFTKADNFIYVFIAIIGALMFLFQNIFYRNKIKLREQEIKFLEERVKDLEKRVKK